MTLTKQHLSRHAERVEFDVRELGRVLMERCPDVIFALLMGSARDGVVDVGSDVDVALYVRGRPKFELYHTVLGVVADLAPKVHCDVGILNHAEPIYRFEALGGRLLFTRDQEAYLRFFSIACREYESQLMDYQRQYRYRTGMK